MTTGWDKDFSPELLAKLDYVLMDPQTIPTWQRAIYEDLEFRYLC